MINKALQNVASHFGYVVFKTRVQSPISDHLLHATRLWSASGATQGAARLRASDELSQRASMLAYLSHMLEACRIECVVDIGANHGQFAGILRSLGYRGAIFSFEPVRLLFKELERAAKSDPRWTVYNYGLSSMPSRALINVYADDSLSSVSSMNDYGDRMLGGLAEVVRTESVELRPLDDWFDVLTKFSSIFVKIDTQGHDLEVLRGGAKVIGAARAVLCELPVRPIYQKSFLPAEAAEMLAESGLHPTRSFPVALDEALNVIEADQFFVRA